MKKLVIGLGVISVLCFVALVFGGFFTTSIGCKMDQSINNLRQLHLAIYSYAQDANEADDGRPKPYPASLQDLATYGYLKQADLEKLTTGDLYYYRPVGEPSEKTLVLELSRETNTIYAEWDGSVYSKPRKK